MNPSAILKEASLAGVFVALDGDRLKISGPADERKRLRPVLQAHREAIRAHLVSTEAAEAMPPHFCTGTSCPRHEVISLPRQGQTAGCIIHGKDYEIWRPLRRVTGCPAMGDR